MVHGGGIGLLRRLDGAQTRANNAGLWMVICCDASQDLSELGGERSHRTRWLRSPCLVAFRKVSPESRRRFLTSSNIENMTHISFERGKIELPMQRQLEQGML